MRYVFLAVLALAACKADLPAGMVAGPGDITSPAQITMVPNGESAVGMDYAKMDWTLGLIDGKPAGYNATLNLGTKGSMSGQGPCNSYTAGLKSDGKIFKPAMIASTRMACENMTAEASFFKILAAMTTMDQVSGQLTLRGGGHELIFMQPMN